MPAKKSLVSRDRTLTLPCLLFVVEQCYVSIGFGLLHEYSPNCTTISTAIIIKLCAHGEVRRTIAVEIALPFQTVPPPGDRAQT